MGAWLEYLCKCEGNRASLSNLHSVVLLLRCSLSFFPQKREFKKRSIGSGEAIEDGEVHYMALINIFMALINIFIPINSTSMYFISN